MLSEARSKSNRWTQALTRALSVCCLVYTVGGCDAQEEGRPPPLDQLYNPLGLAAHPDGRYLFVTNSIFNRQYNASSITVIDTFTGELLPDRGVSIGLFAGELGLTKVCRDPSRSLEDADCESRLIGMAPSRDQGTLTSFEVVSDDDGVPEILCGQASGRDRCAGRFVQASLDEESEKSAPFSLSVTPRGAYLTHLNSGVVSRWRFTEDAPYIQRGCQVRLKGANLIAQHPLRGTALVSDRLGFAVYQTQTTPLDEERCLFEVLPQLNVGSALLPGEGRGISFSADGSQLYHVQSSQEVLHIYQVLPLSAERLSYRRLNSIPVGQQANIVRVPGVYPGGAQSDEQREITRLGEGLIYVSASSDNQVIVIDPVRAQVIAQIEVGEGPYDISFMLNEAGELRGYVSLFKDQAVSVLDLHPESPRRFTELKVIQ